MADFILPKRTPLWTLSKGHDLPACGAETAEFHL